MEYKGMGKKNEKTGSILRGMSIEKHNYAQKRSKTYLRGERSQHDPCKEKQQRKMERIINMVL